MASALSGIVITRDAARLAAVTRAFELDGGYALIVTVDRPMMEGHELPPETLALLARVSQTGRAVYVEAEFFGGTGEQAAIGYENGQESFGPVRTQTPGEGLGGFDDLSSNALVSMDG